MLFITDSNLHRMRTEIMNHGTSVEKIFCPTFRDIDYVVENSHVKKKPSKIYVQVGTNDIETNKFSEEEMKKRLLACLNKLKSINPEADIFLSTILPRVDFKNNVAAMNTIINKLSRSIPGIILVDHHNINADMLTDKKHVNREGFRQLLANIRFALFGKLPKYQAKYTEYRKRQHNRDQKYEKYNYSRYDERGYETPLFWANV